MKNTLLLIIISLFLFTGCKEKCTEYAYNWEIPVTLSPAQDTFNIGDTITITSTFQDAVYDQINGKEYKLINYTFFPECSLIQIDSIPASEQGLSGKLSTNATLISNSIYLFYLATDVNGFEVARGKYDYSDNTYRLNYKLVLKKKGLFLFRHSSTLNEAYLGGQDFEGRCRNAVESANVVLNNGDSNNVEMLNDGYDTYKGGYMHGILKDVKGRFENKGGYCFYVKE